MFFCCSNQAHFGANSNQKGGFKAVGHATKRWFQNGAKSFSRGFGAMTKRPFKYVFDRQKLVKMLSRSGVGRKILKLDPSRLRAGFGKFLRNPVRSMFVGAKYA